MSSLFNARVLADAQAVLGDTDTWDGPTWQRAAITLASAVISAEMRTTGASLDNLLPHVVCECGGTGEVAVTPGQPGDGPMPCPTCSTAMSAGRRIPDGQWFDRPRQAGDYGAMEVEGQGVRWFNRPPNSEPDDPDCVLNENHVVLIEMDGKISVHASIENRVYLSEQVGGRGPISTFSRPWHGHLEHGVWREF